MSTINTTIGHEASVAEQRGKGLLSRLYDGFIRLRERQGAARVGHLLADMSDHRLRDIGFDEGEIAEMRMTRRLPARFGRNRGA
jgi:uncharacterized protein YjiS (DUF1127 family)